MFNAEAFLNSKTQQAGETKYTLPPEGWYKAISSELDEESVRQFDTKNGTGTALNMRWVLQDTSGVLEQATGRDRVTVRQNSIWLDVTPEGFLDGDRRRNVPLNRLREVLGQNEDGQDWGPRLLGRQAATVLVEHDESGEYANVTQVMPYEWDPTPEDGEDVPF